ncbi:MAG: hypothetical protein KGH65_01650 [Candidatus Micrarchaeota archaeon]|nr:hypothetical protein [Candidatus Micrarchaeota archaeon]
METLVRLEGAVATILEELVKRGFYKTKSDAIRAGILELGKEYIPKSELEARLVSAKIKRIESQIKKGKVKLVPFEQVAKKAGLKL